MNAGYTQWLKAQSVNGIHRKDLSEASFTAQGFNANCGDRVSIGVSVEAGRLSFIGYQARACAVCQASMHVLCEQLQAMPISDARQHIQAFITAVHEQQGWPEGTEPFSAIATSINRHKCLTLGWEACLEALQAHSEKSLSD